MPPTKCMSIQNAKDGKGHNSDKNVAKALKCLSEKGHNLYKNLPKVHKVAYAMILDRLRNFMNLALEVLESFCLQDFPMPKYMSEKGASFDQIFICHITLIRSSTN